MATKYTHADWRFNGAEFAKALRNKAKTGDFQALGELIGVSAITIATWATNTHHGDFPHPSMGNFIKTCNALDLDPRDFWELDK